MGVRGSPRPRSAQQCPSGETAPEQSLLLSPTPSIALLRLSRRNFSPEKGFLPLISIREKMWGYPGSSRGSQLPPQPHHVLGGTQSPSIQPGWAQHPASQLAARSVKELSRTPEHFSAQTQLRPYAKCEPLGFRGGNVRCHVPLQEREKAAG